MKMEYKILQSYRKGVLLTRQPEVINGESLYITFTGAPEGATAIFQRKSDKSSIYRLLKDLTCEVPEDFLDGEIALRVSLMDGTVSQPVFVCEEIKATKTDMGTLVCPNDTNVPETLVEIQLDMQTISDKINKLMDKYSELNTKLEKLLEGYDIT